MTGLAIPTLDTNRLILRAPRLSDLPRMTAFFATPRSHMVGGPRTETETFQSLASRLGHWALRDYGLWHIEEKASGLFLGWAGMIFAPGWDEPELGWTVMRDAEGKGIASEAAIAARTYAGTHQNLNGVISYIDPENTRSMTLAQRLGAAFERTGQLLGKPYHIYRHPMQKAAYA